MKILLYSIFTNEYKQLLPLWLKYTAENFYKGSCDVLVLTDDASSISVPSWVMVKELHPSYCYKNLELLAKNSRHCEILDSYKDSYDTFVSLQSNCLVTIPLDETNFPIDRDKLTVFVHISYPHCQNVLETSVAKRGSCAYRSLVSYGGVYVHGGMTMGGYEVMKKMNEDCQRMLESDMERDFAHKLKWHDETLLNTWRVDNKDKVKVLAECLGRGKLSDIPDIDSFDGTFFYLLDKEDYLKKKEIVAPSYFKDCKLGNHLFAFATAYAYALRWGYDFRSPFEKTMHKILGYKFNCNCDDIDRYYREPSYSYMQIPPTVYGYIAGFFQTSKYFKDFEKEVKDALEVLWKGVEKDPQKAAIHIRLGDYLTQSWRYKSPSKEYIEKALGSLSPSIKKLEIFSDEPTKALDIVKSCAGSEKFEIILNCDVDAIDAIRGIISASEFIMSCSSFSWWAAYLGNHDKVLVEAKWFADDELDEENIYESSWIRV